MSSPPNAKRRRTASPENTNTANTSDSTYDVNTNINISTCAPTTSGISAELLSSFGLAPDALNDHSQASVSSSGDVAHSFDDAALSHSVWSSLQAAIPDLSSHSTSTPHDSTPVSTSTDTSAIPLDPALLDFSHPLLNPSENSQENEHDDFAAMLAQQVVSGVTQDLERLNQPQIPSSDRVSIPHPPSNLSHDDALGNLFPTLDLQQMLTSAARQAVEEVGREEDSSFGPTPEPIMTPNGPVYPCLYPSCDKTFARLYNLKSHSRTHQDERPFKCSVCPLAFSRQHDLKRHIKVHVVIKPFRCKGCDKMFSRMDALRRHKSNPKSLEICGTSGIEQDLDKELEGKLETERLLGVQNVNITRPPNARARMADLPFGIYNGPLPFADGLPGDISTNSSNNSSNNIPVHLDDNGGGISSTVESLLRVANGADENNEDGRSTPPLPSAPPPTATASSFTANETTEASEAAPKQRPTSPEEAAAQALKIVSQLQTVLRRHQDKLPAQNPDSKLLHTLANAKLNASQAAALLKILSQVKRNKRSV